MSKRLAKIKDKDLGMKRILHDLNKLQSLTVDVGLQAGEKSADGVDLAYIGAIHEFGGTWQVKRRVTHYKRLSKAGDRFLHGGRFVKRKRANYSESFDVEGTVTVPSRPFMRSTFDKKASEVARFGGRCADKVVTGALQPEVAAVLVGQTMEKLIKEGITSGPWAPNAPSTIRRKKSSKPLIDKGRMRASIKHVVRKRGSRKVSR